MAECKLLLRFHTYKNTQNGILERSSTHDMVQNIGKLARQMVDEHIANKIQMQKDLRQRLTKEFVELGSMSKVIKNNSGITSDAIKQHVRTSLRLPPKLKTLENEGNLHPKPDCSLQIALFAVNYYEWDDKKNNAKKVVQMAQAISTYVNKNNDLNQIFSDKIKANNYGANTRNKNNKNGINTATAAWVATATLHKLYGVRMNFSNNDIREKMLEQNICSINMQNFPINHKKLYRVSRGVYKLYCKSEHYDGDRKQETQEPRVEELSDKYKDLIQWYHKKYCKKK